MSLTGCNVFAEQATANESAVFAEEERVVGGVEVECADGTLGETGPNAALVASLVVVDCGAATAYEVWAARRVLL